MAVPWWSSLSSLSVPRDRVWNVTVSSSTHARTNDFRSARLMAVIVAATANVRSLLPTLTLSTAFGVIATIQAMTFRLYVADTYVQYVAVSMLPYPVEVELTVIIFLDWRLSVCLSACSNILKTARPNFTKCSLRYYTIRYDTVD